MRISDIFARERPTFSFEFMAPRTHAEGLRILEAVRQLASLAPDFVCVTCRPESILETIALAGRVKSEFALESMAHILSWNLSLPGLNDLVARLADGEIHNVLALRGDHPLPREPEGEHFHHASELIAHLSRHYAFCVGGACYPEGHVESPSLDEDVRFAKLKEESGASFLITQMFFENHNYEEFVTRARSAGVTVPILPGLMPITNRRQVSRIKQMGVTIPEGYESALLACGEDDHAISAIGVAWASLQCEGLLRSGAPGLHFYTFNRSAATRAILGALRAVNVAGSRLSMSNA